MSSLEAPPPLAKVIKISVYDPWAGLHVEHSKRRVVQRSDIAIAITKCGQFNLLVDIVSREDIEGRRKEYEMIAANSEIPAKLGSTCRNRESEVKFLAQRHQVLQQPTGRSSEEARVAKLNGF